MVAKRLSSKAPLLSLCSGGAVARAWWSCYNRSHYRERESPAYGERESPAYGERESPAYGEREEPSCPKRLNSYICSKRR